MIIKVDKEAQGLIKNLCDVALKTAGLANLEGVLAILNKMELLEEKPKPKPKPKPKKDK